MGDDGVRQPPHGVDGLLGEEPLLDDLLERGQLVLEIGPRATEIKCGLNTRLTQLAERHVDDSDRCRYRPQSGHRCQR